MSKPRQDFEFPIFPQDSSHQFTYLCFLQSLTILCEWPWPREHVSLPPATQWAILYLCSEEKKMCAWYLKLKQIFSQTLFFVLFRVYVFFALGFHIFVGYTGFGGLTGSQTVINNTVSRKWFFSSSRLLYQNKSLCKLCLCEFEVSYFRVKENI